MIYAPVIIPTLNRYEHLKKCLESLECCTGAEYTDVYVALDFPPSEKYVDGWKKNDTYLKKKEENHKFKSLTVYRREENYFFSGKGNWQTAINDLPDTIDRYIFSEDDNVFSPNFLEFINKGLEKYKEDFSVLAICGYCHPYPIKYGDNNYFMQNVDFSAWGYGIWKNRDDMCATALDKMYHRKKILSFSNCKKLYNNGLNRVLDAINSAFFLEKIPNSDNTLSVYMALENMNVVMPVVTKVRNIGWDGSGVHCNEGHYLKSVHSERIIDDEKAFDYMGNGMNFYKENRNIFVAKSYAHCSFLHFVVSLIRLFVKKIMRE